jgi:GNAT superfamily N-acetyltransferase
MRNQDKADAGPEPGAVARSRALETLPPGYVSRPLTAGDVNALWELEAAGEVFDDGVVEVDLSDLEAEWRQPAFNPAVMSMGVFRDDRLVAYAKVFQGRAEALVHPKHRGEGIGSALIRWTWEVARREGRARVGQTISDNETAAEALFRANGYEYGHTSWILRVELEAPPSPILLPAGYRFRPYRPGKDDREVYRLIDGAFAEWRGLSSESMGFENWVASTLYKVPAELVVLIESGPTIVGAAIGYDYGEDIEGWIEQVAVEKTHRGRGLGRALLQESFRRFWELGRRQCGVSTDSRTGALGLYEHVGMSVRRSYTRWMKQDL